MRAVYGNIENVLRIQSLPVLGLQGFDLLRRGTDFDTFVHLEFVAESKGDFVGSFLQWHRLVGKAEIIRLTEAYKVLARRGN
jgi:hypothetical protein